MLELSGDHEENLRSMIHRRQTKHSPTQHWQTHRVGGGADASATLSVRGLLAALGILIAGLHLMVATSRGADWRVEGMALTLIGLVAAISAVTLLVSATSWPVLVLAVTSSISAVGVMVTRLVGYPFGPFADYTPPLTAFDIIVMIAAVIAATLAFSSRVVGIDHLGRPGLRFDTVAPVIVVLAALPGLNVSVWAEEAAYITGQSHSHGVTTVTGETVINGLASADLLTTDERVRLGEQLVAARAAGQQYPTLADAIGAGWVPLGNFVPGSGQMVIDPNEANQQRLFDPSLPSALLYATNDERAPIVGVQYDLWGSNTPDGFIGQGPLWHLHAGTCVIDDERGSFALPYDQPLTGTACQDIDARLTPDISWMIRAWVMPGWDNPRGPFAHDHPLLITTT